jgi:putative aldouronate transport system permease protein
LGEKAGYVMKKYRGGKNRFEFLDLVLSLLLIAFALIIVMPFVNVIAVSFSSQKEYLSSQFLLVPRQPVSDNYAKLLMGDRIWIGYRSTLLILMIGVPINMMLTASVAYGLSRPAYPGKKLIFYAIVFTMLFNGGIVPLYLVMRELRLTNTIWSVIFAYGINSFYMIIMRSYMQTIPEALLESAKLDGAGEWRLLFQIILPLSMPIIATVILFYSVDRWNEWFNAMIFIRKNNFMPLQLVLRSIVAESRAVDTVSSSAAVIRPDFSDGIKAACVIVVMLPVMCVFPFLQKYFVKGVLIGAIKS